MPKILSDEEMAYRALHPYGARKRHGIDTRKRHDAADTRTNTHKSKFALGNFVAIDGEGISLGEPLLIGAARVQRQNYVLLKNSLGDKIVNLNGLDTDACLDFVLDSARSKSSILVCYGASYDINMALRDLSEQRLRQLHSGKRVFYKNYILGYKPRKEFNICQFRREWNAEKRDNDIIVERSATLWDVLGFFQTSFVTTLRSYFNGKMVDMSTREKYERIIPLIEAGKNERRVFTVDQLETFIEPYCDLELSSLVELMQTFRGYLDKAGLVLNRWDGAGAVAGAMLKKYDVRQHIQDSLFSQELITCAEYAYFGGRIETLLCGNYPFLVYHYDLNSAYPSGMTDIPSFIGGEWTHSTYKKWSLGDVFNAPPVSLFYVEWDTIDKEYFSIVNPFPWRGKEGRVYFPDRGRAWIYKPEMEMALKYFRDTHTFKILESWMYHPAIPTVYPYSFIPDVYRLRQEAIANGDGTQIVYKLGTNSLYGKTAQSKGYNKELKRKPPYHNLIVAGLTTSRTRAKLMEAAMQAPGDIILLATDGIYSRVPLDLPVSESKELGKWEYKTHDYMTVIMSGVYWLGNVDPQKEDAFSRGFDKSFRSARLSVLKAWEEGKSRFPVECTRFVTIGSAVGLNDFSQHCSWRTIDRELDLGMERVAKSRVYDETVDKSKNLVRAYPRGEKGSGHMIVDSAKYAFEWNDNLDGIPTREFLEEMMHSKE